MNRFRVMCVAPFHSFIFFTETDYVYVSICAVTYVPFSTYIYALILMCMRGG
jgi:hypothetical protein